MILLSLLLAVASPASSDGAVTVTGVRLSTLREEHDRCAARGCGPREDVIATVRYAEGLFRTGKYQDAKRVLAGGVSRVKGFAAAEPLAISELYLAQANVALHEGDQEVVRSATHDRARVLRDALPAGAKPLLLAELGIADLELREGRWVRADDLYAALAERARAAGNPEIAAAASLRRATMFDRRGERRRATALLDEVAAMPGEELAGYRIAARALAARFARARGENGPTEALIASLAREPKRSRPTLIWSPPMPAPADVAGLDYYQRVDVSTRSQDLARLGWADIGYLIRPDGSVEEPEVLRAGGAQGWTGQVLKVVAGRRYTPAAGSGAGQYRIERFTLTADYDVPIGSLVRRRIRNPHFEAIDITDASAQSRPTA